MGGTTATCDDDGVLNPEEPVVTVLVTRPLQLPMPTEVRVGVVGELDASTLARVRVQLQDALTERPARLVVDLSDCPFVDAAALTALLDAHRTASRYGGVLALLGCQPRVVRALSLTGLRRVFAYA